MTIHIRPTRRIARATSAALAAVALAASTACSSSGEKSSESASTTTVAAQESSFIRAVDTEPLRHLIPQDSNDVAGIQVINLVLEGLVRFDKNGHPRPAAAEKIDSLDNNTRFVVHLKPGQKFADGTPVTSASFVDAWNFANEKDYLNSHYFKNIAGWKPSHAMDKGLKIIDDNTFQITLAKPQRDFLLALGHVAFYPLPKAALKDIKSYGEKPFGNGPYKVKQWVHEKKITIVPNPLYKGERTPKNKGIVFDFYPSQQAAYTALLGGSLDIVDNLPDTAYATMKQDLDGRAINQPSATLESMHIPERIPHFSGEEGRLRRAAISEAIDRKTIVDKIFHGTTTPAKDFSSSVVDGSNGNLPENSVLRFNPDNAKKLWAKADAISPFKGKLYYAYNADGGYRAWIEAVSNSISSTLPITVALEPYPDFKSLRSAIDQNKVKGAYRGSWSSGYPSVVSFISSRYVAGDATEVGWKNPAYDKEIASAAQAPDAKQAQIHYDAAQKILLKDLPSIPLWNTNAVVGYGPDVDNVVVDWDGLPQYYKLTRKANK